MKSPSVFKPPQFQQRKRPCAVWRKGVKQASGSADQIRRPDPPAAGRVVAGGQACEIRRGGERVPQLHSGRAAERTQRVIHRPGRPDKSSVTASAAVTSRSGVSDSPSVINSADNDGLGRRIARQNAQVRTADQRAVERPAGCESGVARGPVERAIGSFPFASSVISAGQNAQGR